MNNKGFTDDTNDLVSIEKGKPNGQSNFNSDTSVETVTSTTTESAEPERENWGKSIEFLMSCIAMSVGLGNVWRFPFTALENGGGAFLLPYLVVLFVIGRPLYYLEMVIGQFSSKNSIDVFDMVPFFRGKKKNLFKNIWMWNNRTFFLFKDLDMANLLPSSFFRLIMRRLCLWSADTCGIHSNHHCHGLYAKTNGKTVLIRPVIQVEIVQNLYQALNTTSRKLRWNSLKKKSQNSTF